MKKEKTELPGLMLFFRITLIIGLLHEMLNTYQMFVDYADLWGTVYAGTAAIDIGVRLIELPMYIGMLIFIALRKRTFLICFWVDYGCRVFILFYALAMGGSLGAYLVPLIVPTLWAAYFYRSSNFAHAFTPYKPPLLSSEGMEKPSGDSAPPSPPENAPAELASPKPAAAEDASSLSSQAEASCEEVSPPTSPPQEKAVQPPEQKTEASVSAAHGCEVSPKFPGAAVSDKPAEPQSATRRRFCKYCGTELRPKDSLCPSCGKRVRVIISWKKTAFFSLLFFSLICNLVLGIILGRQLQQIEVLSDRQKELSSELYLQKQYSYQNVGEGGNLSWSNTYQRNKEFYKNSDGVSEINTNQMHSITFANKYVAIVTSNGDKWHHPYCFHLANASEVYIYSVAGAEKAGYEPCEDCKRMSYEEFMERYR